MDRRTFLQTSLAAGAVAALPSALFADTPAKKLNILVLGGGRFVGPHLIKTSLARGHKVSAFNRGKTNPGLFPEIEHLIGDRYPDRDAGLSALKGRKWDIVFDTWSREPIAVKAAVEMLKGNVDRYLYVSTISVYKDFKTVGFDENYPRFKPSETDDPAKQVPYGLAKAWAEDFIVEGFGEKNSGLYRPGVIDGEDLGNEPRSQRVYWPLRMRQGGEVLVPGDGTSGFQHIDVRDIADLMVLGAEKGHSGAFNLITPAGKETLGDYFRMVQKIANPSCKLTWVSDDFLLEEKIRPWMELPLWIPKKDDEPGFSTVSNKRAVDHGLKYRTLEDTISGVLKSYPTTMPPNQGMGGITPEKEKELLAAWHAKEAAPKEKPGV